MRLPLLCVGLLAALAQAAPTNVCRDPKNPGHHCADYKGRLQKHLEDEMYWFDEGSGKCKSMTYLGCGGNYNRFRSRFACEEYCFAIVSSWKNPQPAARVDSPSSAHWSTRRVESNPHSLETELGRAEFSDYASCFAHLEPGAQRDFPKANHRAEFDDVIAMRGNSGASHDGRLVSPELWADGVVPYEVSDFLGREQREKLACALRFFAEKTCLRFRAKRPGDHDFIHFTNEFFGCYSDNIGKNGGKHTINLDRHHSHCWLHGTVVHEIMHALGFFHEQSREDRDKYISINWNNVASYNWNEFQRARQRGFKYANIGEYDYKSVMHYPRTTDGKTVMTAVKAPIASNNAAMGNRRVPTDADAAKINRLYQCKDARPSHRKTVEEDQKVLDDEKIEKGKGKGEILKTSEKDAVPSKKSPIDAVYEHCVSKKNGMWNVDTGSCFWWNSTYLSWYDAMKNCSRMAPAQSMGRLAWVRDEATFNQLRAALPYHHLWIGLKAIQPRSTNLTAPGEWGYWNDSRIWSTQKVFDPTKLGVRVYLARDKGDCLVYSQNYWQDDFCSKPQAFLCEFVPDPEKPKKYAADEPVMDEAEGKETHEDLEEYDYTSEEQKSEESTETEESGERSEEDSRSKSVDLDEELGVRVVGRRRSRDVKGRLEVFSFGQWGTVCADSFDDVDAKVACAQLNFSKGRALLNGRGYSVGTRGNIWLDDVKCKGTESDIFDCFRNPIGSHNCRHSEDVGVHCYH